MIIVRDSADGPNPGEAEPFDPQKRLDFSAYMPVQPSVALKNHDKFLFSREFHLPYGPIRAIGPSKPSPCGCLDGKLEGSWTATRKPLAPSRDLRCRSKSVKTGGVASDAATSFLGSGEGVKSSAATWFYNIGQFENYRLERKPLYAFRECQPPCSSSHPTFSSGSGLVLLQFSSLTTPADTRREREALQPGGASTPWSQRPRSLRRKGPFPSLRDRMASRVWT